MYEIVRKRKSLYYMPNTMRPFIRVCVCVCVSVYDLTQTETIPIKCTTIMIMCFTVGKACLSFRVLYILVYYTSYMFFFIWGAIWS